MARGPVPCVMRLAKKVIAAQTSPVWESVPRPVSRKSVIRAKPRMGQNTLWNPSWSQRHMSSRATSLACHPLVQLNDLELLAVVAFLQSQGGEVTVNGQSHFPKWRGEGGGAAPAAAAPATAAAPPSGASGQELVQQWGCITCHKFDGPDKLVGPSLWDVGARKDANYIRESILEPDAVVVEGFPPGLMKGTLDGQGFYQKLSLQDLNTIVNYLTSLKGGK